MPRKRIAILGSTGSIGCQTLDVVRQHPDRFEVKVITAGSNASLLAEQANEFSVPHAVICNESKYEEVRNAITGSVTQVHAGISAACDLVTGEDVDIVVASMVGFSGLRPTLSAIRAGKDIALANKETLVAAGSVVMAEARRYGVHIFPVDSEHSAIFQCLQGAQGNRVERIHLTASGGPFRTWTRDRIETAGKDRLFTGGVVKVALVNRPGGSELCHVLGGVAKHLARDVRQGDVVPQRSQIGPVLAHAAADIQHTAAGKEHARLMQEAEEAGVIIVQAQGKHPLVVYGSPVPFFAFVFTHRLILVSLRISHSFYTGTAEKAKSLKTEGTDTPFRRSYRTRERLGAEEQTEPGRRSPGSALLSHSRRVYFLDGRPEALAQPAQEGQEAQQPEQPPADPHAQPPLFRSFTT